MPYRVQLSEHSLTIEFDTREEGAAAYEAVRHLVPYLGPARPVNARPAASQPPEGAPAPKAAPPQIHRSPGGAVPRGYHWSTNPIGKTKARSRMLAWLRALQDIDANAAGISSRELSRRLKIAGPTGIGQSYHPIRKILEKHGFDDPREVFGKIQIDGQSRYVRTDKTESAVAILRQYFED